MPVPNTAGLLEFDVTHAGGHVLSILAMLASMLGFIPAVAAVAALVWYGIQIWESKTFQAFMLRRRSRMAKRHIIRIQRDKALLQDKLTALTNALTEAEGGKNGGPVDPIS